jgi:hypothetical protein
MTISNEKRCDSQTVRRCAAIDAARSAAGEHGLDMHSGSELMVCRFAFSAMILISLSQRSPRENWPTTRVQLPIRYL